MNYASRINLVPGSKADNFIASSVVGLLVTSLFPAIN